MNKIDHRKKWRQKNDLELMLTIHNFMEKHGVKTVRDYQKSLSENSGAAPSVWFISEKYGSFEKMLVSFGKANYNRYRWNNLTDKDLEQLVKDYIEQNNIRSQRAYEVAVVGEDLPSLSTVKKRLGDVRYLFQKKSKDQYSDFELLTMLKEELIKLGMEDNLSMTEFNKRCNNSKLPSTMTIMRRSNKTWEELMEEIGFDYRSIKVEKLSKNLKNVKK